MKENTYKRKSSIVKTAMAMLLIIVLAVMLTAVPAWAAAEENYISIPLNEDGVPAYSSGTGWEYFGGELRIRPYYTYAPASGTTLECSVINEGTIIGGQFTGTITNTQTGVLSSGEYNAVLNFGTVYGGTGVVNNYDTGRHTDDPMPGTGIPVTAKNDGNSSYSISRTTSDGTVRYTVTAVGQGEYVVTEVTATITRNPPNLLKAGTGSQPSETVPLLRDAQGNFVLEIAEDEYENLVSILFGVNSEIPPHIHVVTGIMNTVAQEWKPVAETFQGGTLSSGYWFLENDTVLNTPLSVASGGVYLCLNGHTLSCTSSPTVQVGSNGGFILCDCGDGGCIIGANGIVNEGATDIRGGKIIGNGTASDCGIGIQNSGGTLNIYGGRVEGSVKGICNQSRLNVKGGEIYSPNTGIENLGNATLSAGTIIGTECGIYNNFMGVTANLAVNGAIIRDSETAVLNNGYMAFYNGTIAGSDIGIENVDGSGVLIIDKGLITADRYGIIHTGDSFTMNTQLYVNAPTAIYLGGGKHVTVNENSATTVSKPFTVELADTAPAFITDYNSREYIKCFKSSEYFLESDLNAGRYAVLAVGPKVVSIDTDRDSILLQRKGATAVYGIAYQVEVTPEDGIWNETLKFSSSNAAVASIDTNGVITANNNGTAVITISLAEDKTVSTTMDVMVAYVSGIRLNKSQVNLTKIGAVETLIATVSPDDMAGSGVIWSCDDESIATVDADGKITAIAEGTATVIARSAVDNTKMAACSVTVKNTDKVIVDGAGITLNKNVLTLPHVGDSEQLTATISPNNSNNQIIVWTTSDGNIATVANDGTVTAEGVGSAIITAVYDGNPDMVAKCTVQVLEDSEEAKVKSLTVSENSIEFACAGDEATVTVTYQPETAKLDGLTWDSEDKAVATVSPEGVITAVGKGETMITVCDINNPNVKTSVRVKVASSFKVSSDESNPNGTWTKEQGGDFTVKCTGSVADLKSVKIDGKELTAEEYSVEEVDGVTVLSIKESFLKSLKDGTHELVLDCADESVSMQFSVGKKDTLFGGIGGTGDDLIGEEESEEEPQKLLLPYIIGGVVVLAGVGAAVFFLRKKKKK